MVEIQIFSCPSCGIIHQAKCIIRSVFCKCDQRLTCCYIWKSGFAGSFRTQINCRTVCTNCFYFISICAASCLQCIQAFIQIYSLPVENCNGCAKLCTCFFNGLFYICSIDGHICDFTIYGRKICICIIYTFDINCFCLAFFKINDFVIFSICYSDIHNHRFIF